MSSRPEKPDRLGCIKASEVHEVVVYEDRGENLNHLNHPTNTVNKSTPRHPMREGLLFRTYPATHAKDKKAELRTASKELTKQTPESNKRIRAFLSTLIIPAKSLPGQNMQEASTSREEEKANSAIDPKNRANKSPKRESNLKVHKATCEGILRLCRDKSEVQSTTVLENAETATNDNDSQQGKKPQRACSDWEYVVNDEMSVLVNGFQGPKSCDRLIVYEALMSHFGSHCYGDTACLQRGSLIVMQPTPFNRQAFNSSAGVPRELQQRRLKSPAKISSSRQRCCYFAEDPSNVYDRHLEVAAIPDDANAKAMSHLDRIVAKINEMNVFLFLQDEQCTYDLVHQLKTPVASLELGFLVCDVGISLLIDSKCNTWAFQRTSASLRMDLLHIAKKLVNVVDGGLSARCAALASVK
ncbi:hypothetical protein EVAR_11560_1 [Eumeta japonica]|uniref:Uncharacterized protein n=1 Tax=Eumeta variegata TaxID=151549 RepID=A0A4C1X5Y5_EUMVA|nr:hypothetical protein EVAR_11560_1 [Eumeta japonica]